MNLPIFLDKTISLSKNVGKSICQRSYQLGKSGNSVSKTFHNKREPCKTSISLELFPVVLRWTYTNCMDLGVLNCVSEFIAHPSFFQDHSSSLWSLGMFLPVLDSYANMLTGTFDRKKNKSFLVKCQLIFDRR